MNFFKQKKYATATMNKAISKAIMDRTRLRQVFKDSIN